MWSLLPTDRRCGYRCLATGGVVTVADRQAVWLRSYLQVGHEVLDDGGAAELQHVLQRYDDGDRVLHESLLLELKNTQYYTTVLPYYSTAMVLGLVKYYRPSF